MASGSITSWQIHGKTMETVTDLVFLASKITADGECSHEIKRRLFLGRKAMTNLDSMLKSKGLSSESYRFSSSHVWMWELDHKECWAPKNWCFWTVVLEKTFEVPLDCRDQTSHTSPKGNQSRIFIGRTDAEIKKVWGWSYCSGECGNMFREPALSKVNERVYLIFSEMKIWKQIQ